MLPLHAKELITFQPGSKADEAIDETKLFVRLAVPTITGRMQYEREMAATGILPTSIAMVRAHFREGVEQIMEEPERSQMLGIYDRMVSDKKDGDAPTDASAEQVAPKDKLTPEELALFGTAYAKMLQEYPPMAEAAADAGFWNDVASMVLCRLFLKEIHDPDGLVLKKDARGWVKEETLSQLGLVTIRAIGNKAWSLMTLTEAARKN